MSNGFDGSYEELNKQIALLAEAVCFLLDNCNDEQAGIVKEELLKIFDGDDDV